MRMASPDPRLLRCCVVRTPLLGLWFRSVDPRICSRYRQRPPQLKIVDVATGTAPEPLPAAAGASATAEAAAVAGRSRRNAVGFDSSSRSAVQPAAGHGWCRIQQPGTAAAVSAQLAAHRVPAAATWRAATRRVVTATRQQLDAARRIIRRPPVPAAARRLRIPRRQRSRAAAAVAEHAAAGVPAFSQLGRTAAAAAVAAAAGPASAVAAARVRRCAVLAPAAASAGAVPASIGGSHCRPRCQPKRQECCCGSVFVRHALRSWWFCSRC